ncbi:MAG: Gram-negative bacterial TonB protein C-terminal [Acidobacteriota bacterium]|jgi:TonB family protein|nr:Gram-negative bacterial TonB protein C-terminal [Acidobacteriota bacterium]
MKRLFLAATIVASAILSIGVTLPIDERPIVTKAVAPSTYPPIARAARAEGKVIVEVKINDAGDVTKAKRIEGHKLLEAVTMQAARLWKFAPGADNRTTQLTFTFGMAEDKDRISFIPPYEVEYIGETPVINIYATP